MSLVSEGALDDFDKAKPSPAPPPTTTAPDASGPQKRSPGDTAKDALFASQEKFFQELFDSELASQATAEFEKAMKELAEEEPHLVEQFQKLSEAAGRVGEERTSDKWIHLNRPLKGWGRKHPPHHAEYYAEPIVQGCAIPITEGDHRKVSRMVAESPGISISRTI
uniref:Peroxisomal biosis factor 19 n=1 Tax=Prolemur simus TaxID=1328070 RepID=A0A8C9ANA2_PROSS